jgi:hypothetical protein
LHRSQKGARHFRPKAVLFLDVIRPVARHVVEERLDTGPGIPPAQRFQPFFAFRLGHEIKEIGRFVIEAHGERIGIDTNAARSRVLDYPRLWFKTCGLGLGIEVIIVSVRALDAGIILDGGRKSVEI